MKYLFILLLLISCTSKTNKREVASLNAPLSHIEMVAVPGINLKLRAGYFLEEDKLNGCLVYLQGLGDSIKNHSPFFTTLSKSGYRVITFDYLGQGGSQGSMNKTRVETKFPPDATSIMLRQYNQREKYLEIGNQAQHIWKHFSKVENQHGESCVDSKKFVIGWSTGGLAAYKMANELKADGVVLIAPGIHIKFLVGESKKSPSKLVFLKEVITERTLTRNKFFRRRNPHLDPVKPTSPAHVPQFAGNLYFTSKYAQSWKISKDIPGLIFLSGREDTYVDRDRTIATIRSNSPHFEVTSYEGALHELDNEIDSVTDDLYSKTILFLNAYHLK